MILTIIASFKTGEAAAQRAHLLKKKGYEVVLAGPADMVTVLEADEELRGKAGDDDTTWWTVLATKGELENVDD